MRARADALQQESDRQAGILNQLSPTQLADAEAAYEALQKSRARQRIEQSYEALFNPESAYGNREIAREQLAADIKAGILTTAEFESIRQAAESKYPNWQGAAGAAGKVPVAGESPADALSVPLLADSDGGGGHDAIVDSIMDPIDNSRLA